MAGLFNRLFHKKKEAADDNKKEVSAELVLQMPATVGEKTATIYGKGLDWSGAINVDGYLTSVPAEIWLLTNLTSLGLVGHELTSLPSDIKLLTNLTVLALSDNKLTTLPREIGWLTSLKTLFVNDNELQDFPAEIGQLTNLAWLVVEKNKLKHLPSEIGQLDKVQKLSVKRNPDLTLTSAEFAQQKSSLSGHTNAELFAEAIKEDKAPPIMALLKAEAAFIEQARVAKAAANAAAEHEPDLKSQT